MQVFTFHSPQLRLLPTPKTTNFNPISLQINPRCSAFSRIPARDKVIEFGKHKGKMLGALPSSYLKWVSKNLRARDFEEWAKLADEVLQDPVYKDRIEWEAAERVLAGGGAGKLSEAPVSEFVGVSERFGWDNEDREGWGRVNFELLGTSKGGRIPRRKSGGLGSQGRDSGIREGNSGVTEWGLSVGGSGSDGIVRKVGSFGNESIVNRRNVGSSSNENVTKAGYLGNGRNMNSSSNGKAGNGTKKGSLRIGSIGNGRKMGSFSNESMQNGRKVDSSSNERTVNGRNVGYMINGSTINGIITGSSSNERLGNGRKAGSLSNRIFGNGVTTRSSSNESFGNGINAGSLSHEGIENERKMTSLGNGSIGNGMKVGILGNGGKYRIGEGEEDDYDDDILAMRSREERRLLRRWKREQQVEVMRKHIVDEDEGSSDEEIEGRNEVTELVANPFPGRRALLDKIKRKGREH